jgi:hypothetical protein
MAHLEAVAQSHDLGDLAAAAPAIGIVGGQMGPSLIR